MLPVALLPEAAEEFKAAADWYEEQSPGLGQTFKQKVLSTFDMIAENPRMFQRVRSNHRRAVVSRFPYSVFFSVEAEVIVVAAVFHSSRDPRMLAKRL